MPDSLACLLACRASEWPRGAPATDRRSNRGPGRALSPQSDCGNRASARPRLRSHRRRGARGPADLRDLRDLRPVRQDRSRRAQGPPRPGGPRGLPFQKLLLMVRSGTRIRTIQSGRTAIPRDRLRKRLDTARTGCLGTARQICISSGRPALTALTCLLWLSASETGRACRAGEAAPYLCSTDRPRQRVPIS